MKYLSIYIGICKYIWVYTQKQKNYASEKKI